MYLQLEENSTRKKFNYGGFSQNAKKQEDENPYVFVPDPSGQTSGLYIREDYFDYMTPFEWRQFMAQLAPFQPAVEQGTMSEGKFLNDRASRKARREKRKEQKEQKRELKNQKRDAKNRLIEARAQGKKEGRGMDVLGSVIDGVKSIFGKDQGGEDQGGGGGGNVPPEPTPKEEKPFYTNPLVIGGGVALLAGGIYLATRKKK